MDLELRIFIGEVKDLYHSSKNEIIAFFNDEGVLGCIEICAECGRDIVKRTGLIVPKETSWEKASEIIENELDVEIIEGKYDELKERAGLCDCGDGLDDFKKPKSF